MTKFRAVAAAACASIISALVVSEETLGAPALFPTTLSQNTTGSPDSTFTGPPDDSAVGIGGQIVTYDFLGPNVVDGPGQDFNVYEVDIGGAEFDQVAISVSANGTDFFSVSSTEAAAVDVDGDEAHSGTDFRRSFDIGPSGLTAIRYIRLDGVGTEAAGDNSQFDLDAIGAVNFVPEPASVAVLSLAGMLLLRRRRV